LGVIASYGLRLERKRLLLRALRKRRELKPVAVRAGQIGEGAVVLVATLWNERARMPWFLRHYRTLGVDHFLFADNCSDDGTAEYLAGQPDCSVWRAEGSYRRARFGMDWANWLLGRYARGHWALTVDADELLIYPHSDTRPLQALTEWLDRSGARSFSAMQLDLYPQGPVEAAACAEDCDPVALAPWFDAANYTLSRNPKYGNLWIQGGPRARAFFADAPAHAPALNKIPLVKWHRSYAYVRSTHMLLPRGLNLTYDTRAGEKTCGCLLHTKFLDDLPRKAAAEMVRRQHFAGSREYRAYHEGRGGGLWTVASERFRDWRQLEDLGLISQGNWA
jgi:hypothetical protein